MKHLLKLGRYASKGYLMSQNITVVVVKYLVTMVVFRFFRWAFKHLLSVIGVIAAAVFLYYIAYTYHFSMMDKINEAIELIRNFLNPETR